MTTIWILLVFLSNPDDIRATGYAKKSDCEHIRKELQAIAPKERSAYMVCTEIPFTK